MTTQDIYAWVQMGLQIVIGGGIVVGISRYFGILRRAIESQEKTIAAQAEYMKAQSTVLQDFERLNNMMKHVLDTVSDPAALQREQAYKARVDRDADALVKEQAKQITEKSTQDVALVRQEHNEVVGQFARLIGYMVPFVPPDWRVTGLDSVELDPAIRSSLQALVRDAPYVPGPFLAGGFLKTGGAAYSYFSMGGGRAFISEPILPLNEPQEGTASPN
jgi:hypothetical protein